MTVLVIFTVVSVMDRLSIKFHNGVPQGFQEVIHSLQPTPTSNGFIIVLPSRGGSKITAAVQNWLEDKNCESYTLSKF